MVFADQPPSAQFTPHSLPKPPRFTKLSVMPLSLAMVMVRLPIAWEPAKPEVMPVVLTEKSSLGATGAGAGPQPKTQVAAAGPANDIRAAAATDRAAICFFMGKNSKRC